jgi:hypothetical protein
MPRRRQVRITRQAISPRLAINTRLNEEVTIRGFLVDDRSVRNG